MQEKLQKLDETIAQIDRSMMADDFYEGDRQEVERSRAFFEERREDLRQRLGESVVQQSAA